MLKGKEVEKGTRNQEGNRLNELMQIRHPKDSRREKQKGAYLSMKNLTRVEREIPRYCLDQQKYLKTSLWYIGFGQKLRKEFQR